MSDSTTPAPDTRFVASRTPVGVVVRQSSAATIFRARLRALQVAGDDMLKGLPAGDSRASSLDFLLSTLGTWVDAAEATLADG